MNEPRMTNTHKYKVTVGFSQVTVTGRDTAEALCAARRLLSQTEPRLWDVIFKMEPHRFQIDPLT